MELNKYHKICKTVMNNPLLFEQIIKNEIGQTEELLKNPKILYSLETSSEYLEALKNLLVVHKSLTY